MEAEAILVDQSFSEGRREERTVVVRIDPDDEVVKDRVERSSGRWLNDDLVGFATQRSNIARLRFEINRGVTLEEGHLVEARPRSSRAVLFQIVDGVLHEEAALEGGERAYVVGEAQQLGVWGDDQKGFVSHPWVVPENCPVYRHAESYGIDDSASDDNIRIGHVPSSSFSANIKASSLVLYHSAILGVTGSGKSFLAFSLVESCAVEGVKVLCLDLTGDYARYLPGAVRVPSLKYVTPFLDAPDASVGIIEFSEDGKKHPITSTKEIMAAALAWCRAHRSEEEVREPKAKVLLVLEEAHSLVPEWNANPTRSLQDTVNETAQMVLQARKYGLGVMVVTQRTANVTKSILNQCNTIFAFQAYDETGFEFMKNYMGDHHVRALPNLRKRHGVVVGKASRSDRPLIVRMKEQARKPATKELPVFALGDDSGVSCGRRGDLRWCAFVARGRAHVGRERTQRWIWGALWEAPLDGARATGTRCEGRGHEALVGVSARLALRSIPFSSVTTLASTERGTVATSKV